MGFWKACFVFFVLIRYLRGTEHKEGNVEKTVINRLFHKSRYFLGYELEVEVDLDTDLGESKTEFVSSELLGLLQIPLVDDLLVVSTQGVWRTSSWGEAPVTVYTTGSILDVGFSDVGRVSEELWSSLLSRVSSIMCNSLTVFNSGPSRERSCTQIPEGPTRSRQICNNYDDTLCMDNLSCWTRILPCLSLNKEEAVGSYGILRKIPLDSFVKAPYKSIGFELKKRGDKAYFRIFFNIVIKENVSTKEKKRGTDTLWSLAGLEEPVHEELLCPVVKKSRILYFLNGPSLSDRPSSMANNSLCNIASYNHPVQNDLYHLEIDALRLNNSTTRLGLDFLRQECGLKWIESISDLHPSRQHEDKSRLTFLHIDRSYVRSVVGKEIKRDRTEGSLIIALDNLLPDKSVRVCHWEQFPRYIHPWFYKTRVLSARSKAIHDIEDAAQSKSGDVQVFDSYLALHFLNLSLSGSQNILANFCLDLAPNTNVVVIFKFQKYFLPLVDLGGKTKRGQISPPSVSYWKILQDHPQHENGSYETKYHSISIIPTINLDHTMTFNVLAITCALIVFGFITFTKPIQLSHKNMSL